MSADQLVFCRVCGQAWQGAKPADPCPAGDGGLLVDLEAHQRFPHDPLLGRVVKERFAIVGVLGEGGMGAVYKAIQQPVGRPVALKVINSDMDDPNISARFFQEARVVSRLSDPSIVTLYDYGEAEDGSLYMVFEFIHGRLLFEMLRKEGPFAPKRAVGLVLQILGGLVEAHAMGLVHRDLKPENIMVTANNLGEEKAKVLDFGIAKMVGADDSGVRTREGIVLGTPRYMSPEQAQDLTLDGRSDLYSLGVILYELLTGRAPFVDGAAIEILMAHINRAPPPIDPSRGIPPALVDVVFKALSKKPAERFADAESMARALRAALDAPAAPPPPLLDDSMTDDLGATLMLDDSAQKQFANLPKPPRTAKKPPPPVASTAAIAAVRGRRSPPKWLIPLVILVVVAIVGGLLAITIGAPDPAPVVEEDAGAVKIKIGD